VTCQLVADNVNLYYYTLQDVQYGNPVPSFGIKPAGDLMAVSPLFDLSCPASSVSYLLPLVISSTLSRLFFLLLYNLSIALSLFQYLLSVVGWQCDCPCMNTYHLPVHTPAWAARPLGWSTRANGHAKSSSSLLSSTTTLGSSSLGLSTGIGVVTSEEDGEVAALQ
jgi:glucan endo-1,3-beta-D-glucosidase